MQAIVFSKYGTPDVLTLQAVDKPQPEDDEVLIRVFAASVNDWDWGLLRGVPFVNRLYFGLLKPKRPILGSDIAGRIEAVGRAVTRFKPGDEVYGDLSGRWGGFAEYACTRVGALALKPPAMTFEEAAALPQAAMLALQGLRDHGQVRPGQRVLINGAGGGTGTFAVQLARLYGADVTGVDSAEKLKLLRSLGVEHVLDYTQVDFTKTGERYDLIFDVKTNRSPFAYARALHPDGTYATVGGSLPRLLQTLVLGPLFARRSKKRLRVVNLKPARDLAYMNELYEAGKIKPVIDRTYPLRDVPAAMRYFGESKQRGKIVITMERGGAT